MDSFDKQPKGLNTYTRLNTWNIMKFPGSLVTVSKELSQRKLDFVGGQVRWEGGGGTESAGECKFVLQKEE
jgi:hypothetical protein